MRIIMNISHFYGGKEAIYDIYGNLIEGNLDRGELVMLNKTEDYSRILFYFKELNKLNENDNLFNRYLGKIYYSSININIINNKQIKNIFKKFKKLKNKVSDQMKIVIDTIICKIQYERIPKLEKEFQIGHTFSKDTLNYCKNKDIYNELLPDDFFLSKNILINLRGN